MREERKGKESLSKVVRCCISLDLGFLSGVISKMEEIILVVCVARSQAGYMMSTFLQVCVPTRSWSQRPALGVSLHCSAPYFLRQGFTLNPKLYDWLDFLGNKFHKPAYVCLPLSLKWQTPAGPCLMEWMLGIWTQSLMLTRTWVAESSSLQPGESVWRMAYIWVWMLCSTVSYKRSVIVLISLKFRILIQRDGKAFIVVINFYWIWSVLLPW